MVQNKPTISFIGDLMFGDMPVTFGFGTDSRYKNCGYNEIFTPVKEIFKQSEVIIANFETIIKPRVDDTKFAQWEMCCDDRICKVISEIGIRIVSLANNHSMDYGIEGFNYTREKLENAGITVIGIKSKPYTILIINGCRVAIIGISYVNYKGTNPLYYYKPGIDTLKNTIFEIGEIDFIIAFVHWGVEFIQVPDNDQITRASELIECGVNLIIGHHSHILQSEGLIKNCPVFFSLGNFVSSYWQERLRKTSIIHISFESNIRFKKTNCVINEFCQPIPIRNVDIIFDKINEVHSNESDIIIQRYKVRIEYFLYFIKNFSRITDKRALLFWLFNRLKYILFFFKKELTNPGILYEKY